MTYNYDGEGNWVASSSGTSVPSTTRYLWDTNALGSVPQLALERDGGGSTLRSYAYGLKRISMTSSGGAFFGSR